MEIDDVVRDTFGRPLEAHSFEPINRRSWIRSQKVPIREEVGVRALKGHQFVPAWSISLDFVPHVTKTGRIAWHRTAKQHRADLGVDPVDDPKRLSAGRLVVWGMGPQDGVRKALDRSAGLAVELAEQWFGRITDVPSLIPVFEEAERQPAVRFGFDDYVQHRLAYAFVLARTGNTERARTELDRWCQRHLFGQFGPPEDTRSAAAEKLHELIG
jgi:hypothetical protein